MSFRTRRLWVVLWIGFVGIFLGGCKPASQASQPIMTASLQATSTIAAAPSVTPAPTLGVTQTIPLAVLLASAGSDPRQAGLLRSALEGPITQAGLRWEMRSELNLQEEGLRLVIVLPPDPRVENLALTAPQVQFVTVGMSGLQPSANLSLVGGESRFDQQGFIAGVIAAMLTPDWRVGVIGIADTPEGKAARNGFLNGAVYFCGLCQAYHGPIFDYPLYVEIPSGASQADWQAAVEGLVRQAVKTVYVFPGAKEPAMLAVLAQAGMNLVSSGEPPQGTEGHWIASVEADPVTPFLNHLPDLLAGKGGFEAPMGMVIQNVNPDLFSPGRQGLAGKILAGLLSGEIDTGVDPLTGENR